MDKVRGVYIHIPFCVKICNYCDFFVDKGINQIDDYVINLLNEIDLYFELNQEQIGTKIDSLYFGGGTPSLLSPEQLMLVFDKIKTYLKPQTNFEFSMESNPSSLEREKIIGYKQLGLDRLSIGVQSFNKRELGFLSRSHSPKRAIKSIIDAIDIGISSVNCDLIFSIPNQTKESWEYTLETALDLGTNHLSIYSLTYEKNTPLYRDWRKNKIKKLSDEEDAELYYIAIDKLNNDEFQQYEVSNFCKKGFQCQHNLNIWGGGEYFGFGVSSHYFINGQRAENIRNLQIYSESLNKGKLPLKSSYELTPKMHRDDLIILGLRSTGVNLDFLKDGLLNEKIIELDSFLEKVIKNKYATICNNKLLLLPLGYSICDSITLKLIEILN